ncbi:PRC-barrel domain containing protein [Thermophilibacter provencensis]|uniref:PRC-barrel domain containing protein n=1 Tax=Thermophilibacter provencensis TaxID=1852386 RepID=A0ABT7V4R5_9ACTN|nr:PRC-barrel domain containing protein [Thermophilibacter provencensis]MDM8271591.1 PRC-barrel domain containing protein [Thermophilibacter provencensis]
MLRVGALTGLRVLFLKKTKAAKDGTVTDVYRRLGKVHNAVFSPDGKKVVGLMVKRPDIAGMIKREDAFLAWDSFKIQDEKTLLVTRAEDGLDVVARKRLALDWDSCIMWTGMDAKTVSGKPLGYVSDAEYDEKTGRVTRFLTADGGMARALIGSFVITPEMVCGYANGFMVVDPGDKAVELDGGLAGAAGEGYARAKAKGAEMGKKVGAVAGEAVDKGSFALGRAIGKAKRAIADASAPEQAEPEVPAVAAADVRVEKPVERIAEKSAPAAATSKKAAPKTYAPVVKKKPAPSTGDRVARAAGKQLGSLGKMFGSFKDEFNKASK